MTHCSPCTFSNAGAERRGRKDESTAGCPRMNSVVQINSEHVPFCFYLLTADLTLSSLTSHPIMVHVMKYIHMFLIPQKLIPISQVRKLRFKVVTWLPKLMNLVYGNDRRYRHWVSKAQCPAHQTGLSETSLRQPLGGTHPQPSSRQQPPSNTRAKKTEIAPSFLKRSK